MKRLDILAFILVPILAAISAYFSERVKTGNNGCSLIIIISVVVSFLWVIITKYTKMSLAVATVIFDTLYSLSFFLMFVLLGEKVTDLQWVGVLFSIVGILLLCR